MIAAHRVIADPLPGLASLAELVADPADLAELIALRDASDPIARHATSLAVAGPAAPDSYTGARAPVVMAPFLWFGPSRFSPGTYGVLYAATTVEGAVRDAARRTAKVLAASGAPAAVLPRIAVELELEDDDLADFDGSGDRAASRRFGRDARAAGHSGIRFENPRGGGDQRYAVFRPSAVRSVAGADADIELAWNGSAIASYRRVTTHYFAPADSAPQKNAYPIERGSLCDKIPPRHTS